MMTVALALGLSACSISRADPPPAPPPDMSVNTSTGYKKPLPTQPPDADGRLSNDMRDMVVAQNGYILAHPKEKGRPVAAAAPGQALTIVERDDFPTSVGSVIAVKVTPDGYCVSGYNQGATTANTATKSMLYKSYARGPQADLGSC
jgi:hypothetical protein